MRFGLSVVTKPTFTPISVDTAKLHARIRGRDAEDSYIEDLIEEAAGYLESETMVTLSQTQYRLTMDGFPTYYGAQIYPYDFINSVFRLPRNPVVSVDAINYIDVDGNSQTLPVQDYQVAIRQWPCRVYPAPAKFWPVTEYTRVESVNIQFTAGYANVGAIPPEYRVAVKYMFSHLYEHREPFGGAEKAELPFGIKRMINKMRYAGYTQW